MLAYTEIRKFAVGEVVVVDWKGPTTVVITSREANRYRLIRIVDSKPSKKRRDKLVVDLEKLGAMLA